MVLSHAIDHAEAPSLRSLQENIKSAREEMENRLQATEGTSEFHTLLAKTFNQDKEV